MIDILCILGAVVGVLIGALWLGRDMANDVIDDWSEFPQFLGGIGCYLIWMLFFGLIGFITGPVAVPLAVLAGPVYLGHRYYFNRKKVDY